MDTRARQLIWIGGIALASLTLTFAAVDRLRLPRDLFVLLHAVVTGTLLAGYAARSRVTWPELIGSWRAGLAGAVVTGALMAAFVSSGPSSPAPPGWRLAWAIAWLGIVYGVTDALLLNVFPVVAARRLAAGQASTAAWAIAISLLLTLAYHIGFPEFRGAAMASPLIGNGIMTLSHLATRSALTPLLAHIVLHVAAVTYGYANALPAPPHY